MATIQVNLEIPVNLLDELNDFCLKHGISANVNIQLGVLKLKADDNNKITQLSQIEKQPIPAATRDMPKEYPKSKHTGIFKKAQGIKKEKPKREINPDLPPPKKPPIMGTEDSANPSLEDEINMILYKKKLDEWKIKTGRKVPPKIDEYSERELQEALSSFGGKQYKKETLGDVLKND